MGNTALVSTKPVPTVVVPPLDKKELKQLSEDTGLPVEKISDWHKQYYKDFPSGDIVRSTFQKNYCAVFPGINPKEFSDRSFRFFDKVKDDSIHFSEFIAGISQLESASKLTRLSLSFEFYDFEQNGTIGCDMIEDMVLVLKRTAEGAKGVTEERAREIGKHLFTIIGGKPSENTLEKGDFVNNLVNNKEIYEVFTEIVEK